MNARQWANAQMNKPLVLFVAVFIVAAVSIAVFTSSHNGSKVVTTQAMGTVSASFSIGPTHTACSASSTEGPAPKSYGSNKAMISGSGLTLTYSIDWVTNGCDVTGTATSALSPGSYSLNLSSCTFAGCESALPKSFVITSGNTTDISVTISTDAT